MAKSDQMSREELQVLRKRVTLQLERLSYWGGGNMTAGRSALKDRAFSDLYALLDEIDFELAELGSKNT
jgi:hypothetical protein